MTRTFSRAGLRTLLWLAAVVAAVVVFAGVRLRPQGRPPRLESGNTDAFMYHLPVRAYAFDALRDGRLPLWSPHTMGGQPFLATHQAAVLYPGNFPHWVLPHHVALGAVMALHVAWAAVGMFVWLGTWGFPPSARALGAVTFGLATVVVNPLQWPHVLLGGSWLPWVCAGIDTVSARPGAHAAGRLGAAGTCLLLAGYVQGAVYIYYVAVPYALFRWWQERRHSAAARGTWLAMGLVVLPLLCAAVQLAPMVELAMESARPPDALEPEAFATLGYVAGADILRGLLNWLPPGANKLTLAVPPLAWLLLMLAPRAEDVRGRLIFWGLAGVLAAVLAAGFDTPLYRLYFRLPTGSAFRIPARLLLITACALGVWVAAGASVAHLRSRAVRPSRRALTAAGIGCALTVLVAFSQPLIGAVSIGCFVGWLLVPALRPLWPVAALGALTWSSVHNYRYPIFLPWHGPSPFPDHTAVAEFLQRNLGHERMHIYRTDGDWKSWMYPANWGLNAGLRQLTGYESLPLQRVAGAFNHLQFGGPSTSPIPFVGGLELTPAAPHLEWLHLWSVRWIVVDDGQGAVMRMMPGPPDWLVARLKLQTVEVAGDMLLYNPHALPRAYWVPHGRVVPPGAPTHQSLISAEFDPRTTVLLDPAEGDAGPRSPPPGGPEARVEWLVDGDRSIDLAVSCPIAGWLVVTDAWYPGWQATVDGAAARVRVANGVFRAVRVPAGESLVRMRYRPASVHWGAAASVVGLVSLLAFRAFGSRKARR